MCVGSCHGLVGVDELHHMKIDAGLRLMGEILTAYTCLAWE